jgi:esterase/lipase
MNESKKTIIFLHGAIGCAEDLTPLMGLLKESGYELHSLNFSGHGKSKTQPSEFRIDFFAQELENYILSKNLIDPIVFGYSMGGYVALYHKANFENSRISLIISYGTKFNWTEQVVSKEIQMLDPIHLSEKFPNFVTTLTSKHGENWKNLLRSTAHMIQNLEKLDGLTREDLSDVNIPVVLILGDQDRMVTSEETHLTGSWLHNSQVKTVSHSKHDLDRANIKEIAEIIQDSIASLL